MCIYIYIYTHTCYVIIIIIMIINTITRREHSEAGLSDQNQQIVSSDLTVRAM